MNKPVQQQRKTNTVFTLLLFSCFAMAVLITLMLGVRFYQQMIEMASEGYDERTCLSYIWTKVKNSDGIDLISVGSFGGIPTLYFTEVYGDTTYETRIYPFNGWVYELFCESGLEMDPEDGTPIIKTASLSFDSLEGGLIRISTGEDESFSVLIYPRGKSGIVRGGLH
jgi:hypothetical protein